MRAHQAPPVVSLRIVHVNPSSSPSSPEIDSKRSRALDSMPSPQHFNPTTHPSIRIRAPPHQLLHNRGHRHHGAVQHRPRQNGGPPARKQRGEHRVQGVSQRLRFLRVGQEGHHLGLDDLEVGRGWSRDVGGGVCGGQFRTGGRGRGREVDA